MRYFSLFSGVGGFELGIEKAYGHPLPHRDGQTTKGDGGADSPVSGVQATEANPLPVRDAPSDKRTGIVGEVLHHDSPLCVGFSEIDKHASAVLKYRFPNVKNYGDITQIDWSGVPDFDLLVGGSPCQDLSIAGKRAGLEGGRSGLFYEYVRALEEKKPSYFIWENVKGALSSNQGRDFGAVLSALAEAGYSLWWQVLNAKDFGVPQNRERVFVVGTRTGSPREVFFERGDDEEAPSNLEVTGLNQPSRGLEPRKDGLAASIKAGQSGSQRPKVMCLTPPGTSDAFRVYGTEGVSKTLAANGGGTGAKTGLIRWQNKKDGAVMDDKAPSLRASGGTDIRKRPAVMMTGQPRYDEEGKRVMDYRTTEEAPCIRATQYKSGDNQPRLLQDARIRRLTPVECERLMSWPDDWTKFGDYGDGPKEISDTQRYKMCGNGVVSEVVAAVVKAHLIDTP